MKKLSLIILIAFFSCKKEVVKPKKTDERTENLIAFKNGLLSAKPQGGWFYTGIKTAYMTPQVLYGAATTFKRPRFARNSILQAAWVAVEFNRLPDGRRPWGQYGISWTDAFGDNIVQDFFYLGGGNFFYPNQTLITPGGLPDYGTEIKWSIEKNFDKPGIWNFKRNGVTIWEVDLPGTTHITNAEVFCESQDTRIPRNFPLIEFKPALELMDGEGNYSPFTPGIVRQCNHGIRGTGFNSMEIGKGLECLPTGTILWQ